jgi:hypothetical protein
MLGQLPVAAFCQDEANQRIAHDFNMFAGHTVSSMAGAPLPRRFGQNEPTGAETGGLSRR